MFSPEAKHWANKRTSGQHLAHEMLEKPAMQNLLPDLTGQKVLSIGCGSGEELAMLVQSGGANITGIDTSLELLEQARFNFPNSNFQVMDAQYLDFEGQTFDFVYSSLTLHYLANWPEFFGRLKQVCNPGTEFIFSVHHPIKWGGRTTRTKAYNEFLMGYKKDKVDSSKFEVYGDYLNFRAVEDRLFGQFNITYYHRSIGQMLDEIRVSGWELIRLVEPGPLESTKISKPDFYQTYSRIPLFLILMVKLSDSN